MIKQKEWKQDRKRKTWMWDRYGEICKYDWQRKDKDGVRTTVMSVLSTAPAYSQLPCETVIGSESSGKTAPVICSRVKYSSRASVLMFAPPCGFASPSIQPERETETQIIVSSGRPASSFSERRRETDRLRPERRAKTNELDISRLICSRDRWSLRWTCCRRSNKQSSHIKIYLFGWRGGFDLVHTCRLCEGHMTSTITWRKSSRDHVIVWDWSEGRQISQHVLSTSEKVLRDCWRTVPGGCPWQSHFNKNMCPNLLNFYDFKGLRYLFWVVVMRGGGGWHRFTVTCDLVDILTPVFSLVHCNNESTFINHAR